LCGLFPVSSHLDLLRSNIYLSSLSSDTPSLCSSLNMTDHVSHTIRSQYLFTAYTMKHFWSPFQLSHLTVCSHLVLRFVDPWQLLAAGSATYLEMKYIWKNYLPRVYFIFPQSLSHIFYNAARNIQPQACRCFSSASRNDQRDWFSKELCGH
jgi:hypothetical protein